MMNVNNVDGMGGGENIHAKAQGLFRRNTYKYEIIIGFRIYMPHSNN